MSAFGIKRTFVCAAVMSAFGGKADIGPQWLSQPPEISHTICEGGSSWLSTTDVRVMFKTSFHLILLKELERQTQLDSDREMLKKKTCPQIARPSRCFVSGPASRSRLLQV